jgi:hypothetical protein
MQRVSLKRLSEMHTEVAERLNYEGSVLIMDADERPIGVLVDQREYENLRAIAELVGTREGIESIISEEHKNDGELIPAEDVYRLIMNR